MAAIDAILTRLEAGDHVVVSDNTYGGTFRLFERVRRKFGLDFTYVDTSQLELIEPAITAKTKYLFLETPTNPMLRITDLAAASAIAHRQNVRVIVDNTFASPYIQRPLDLGCDIVTHSTTKFLNGHSDSVGGVVVVKHQDDVEWMKFVQNAAGAILGPMDSFLVLRGTKTLPVRMERTNANAMALAEHLRRHKRVQSAIYPGFPDHPHHALAKKQMRGFGGLISFDVGSIDAARAVLPRFKLMALGESLGGVETLISHPAVMTHASVPAERRAAIGITDGLIRISVGIEDVEDLKEDVDQALS
jgi:cystathionine beta-lyase/cystathionine gamma-synthase